MLTPCLSARAGAMLRGLGARLGTRRERTCDETTPGEDVRQLVGLAACAEARRGREQGERRNEYPEGATDRFEAGGIRQEPSGQEGCANHVREARRTRVLQLPFAEN